MSQNDQSGEVRIIAGQYKGRRLRFPSVQGLRPSGDRIRETVFSWLLPWLPNARVLDLFAGSGALAFEAASRGARVVICNDANKDVAKALRAHRDAFNANMVDVHNDDALALLNRVEPGFDIIFLDPPFRAGWLPKVLTIIHQRELLSLQAVVYIESEREANAPELPSGWEWFRVKESGQVRYALARFSGV